LNTETIKEEPRVIGMAYKSGADPRRSQHPTRSRRVSTTPTSSLDVPIIDTVAQKFLETIHIIVIGMSSVHGQSPESSMLEEPPGPSQDELGNDATPETQPENHFAKAIQAVERSRAIDRVLEEDGKIRKQKCNVLPLGAFKEREIIEMLLKKDPEIGLTEDELLDYRHNIHQWLTTCVRDLVSFIETSDFRLEPDARIQHSYLRGYLSSLDPDAYLSEEFGRAVKTLWNDALLRTAFQSTTDDENSPDPSTT
jgi:hypothetical protein